MFLIFKLSIMIILVIFALTMLLNLISKKSFYDREKNSPFECGFDPKTSSRLPFSLHFFLITVIFLIFDVEITLLFPLILTLKFTNLVNYSLITLIFIVILLIGIYHEWNQGALTWQK